MCIRDSARARGLPGSCRGDRSEGREQARLVPFEQRPRIQEHAPVMDAHEDGWLPGPEDVGEAVEETENGVHWVAASPVQISQAASACSCNIENPSKVLAPSAEARVISAVSLGL